MLHPETVEPRTFALLKRLQNLPELNDFFLVGGTALSLRYGHRISMDLDLFGHSGFNREVVLDALRNEFGEDFVYEESRVKWAIFCFIQNVKIDIVKYDHPIIAPVEYVNDVRLYSDQDIIAMKINAILGRGKKKDFWDIYELLHHYQLSDIIQYHHKKFPKQMLLISIPSALTYFEDAEESEEPISLKGQTCDMIKHFIRLKVRKYLS